MERRKVEAAVSDLLRETGEVRSGILAARLGVSRYTAHSELRRLVEAGVTVDVAATVAVAAATDVDGVDVFS